MRNLKFFSVFFLLSTLGFVSTAQTNGDEKLNLPGDNLNLYAVFNLFQDSETLEGFEKNLNAEESKINNLDLNADNRIDYIKVLDYVDGEDHTIVLQVAINEKENQDVAVFTVQKDANNQVQIQLIGDEELYGKEYIIEPIYDDASTSTPNPGYRGNTNTVAKETVVVTKTTYVEVATWPVVTYIYRPAYVVYRSPWYWGYYPAYWNPWSPFYWDYYNGYHSHYHNYYYGYYHHSNYYRYPQYNNNYYHGHRTYSNTVNQHRQSGTYRNTYSHPETRNQGSADFNKKYPNGYQPAARSNNTSRPATIQGTDRNTTRPTTNDNGRKPTSTSGAGTTARPTTKPATNDNVRKPTTTSGTGTTARPTTKPATNDNVSRPTPKPATSKPAARPTTVTPSTKPASSKETIKKETRETVKPLISKPVAKPSTVAPSTRPNTKTTVPKQGSTKQTTPSRKTTTGSNTTPGTR